MCDPPSHDLKVKRAKRNGGIVIARPPTPPPNRKPSKKAGGAATAFPLLNMNERERAYFQSLSSRTQAMLADQVQNIAHQDSGGNRLGDATSCAAPPRFQVVASQLTLAQKHMVINRMQTESGPKFDTWVGIVTKLPMQVHMQRPDMREDITEIIATSRRTMDAVIVGQSAAKDEVLRLIAQWSMNGQPSCNGVAIGFEGAPGIGKTTFATRCLSVLGRPLQLISLSGAFDASFLIGHSYTYEGSVPGRIIDALIASKCKDPILYFDELDKISECARGKEIVDALIHIIDPSQNTHFRDRYVGFDIDLSSVMFVFSYNDPLAVNPILLDRIKRIRFTTPTVAEKQVIAREHLIPRALARYSFVPDQARITDDALHKMIKEHTSGEAGVRNLEKCIGYIVGCIAVWKVAPGSLSVAPPAAFDVVDHRNVDKILKGYAVESESTHKVSLMYS